MIHEVLKELGPKTLNRIYGQSSHILFVARCALSLFVFFHQSFLYLSSLWGKALRT
jgi:hypothetical protein